MRIVYVTKGTLKIIDIIASNKGEARVYKRTLLLSALSLTIVHGDCVQAASRPPSLRESYYYFTSTGNLAYSDKKGPHGMITEGPRINLTLPDASVKEGDSHVAESCSTRQTNRRENYVHARGDPAERWARTGRQGPGEGSE